MVAFTSAAVAAVPAPGLSAAADFTLITEEFNFYQSQIAFPQDNSEEFRRLTPEMRDQVSKLCLTSTVQIANLLATYVASTAAEEYARFIPLVGSAIAGSFPFCSTYFILDKRLAGIEETAWKFLNEPGRRKFHPTVSLGEKEEFLKGQLEERKDVEIKIGEAGGFGAGKSRFIDAIRE